MTTTVHPQIMPKYRSISQWFNVLSTTGNALAHLPSGSEW